MPKAPDEIRILKKAKELWLAEGKPPQGRRGFRGNWRRELVAIKDSQLSNIATGDPRRPPPNRPKPSPIRATFQASTTRVKARPGPSPRGGDVRSCRRSSPPHRVAARENRRFRGRPRPGAWPAPCG